MSILVLGPSKWRAGAGPRIPAWVGDTLPDPWGRREPGRLQPVDVRAAIVGHLTSCGQAATLMEAHPRRPGEAHSELYRRMVRARRIRRYFIYWPAKAQRAGVDVELGFLLNELLSGKDLDVRVFVESTAGRVRYGSFESCEAGARTRYYEDLLTLGCPIVEWRSYRDLWRALRHHASP